MKVESQTAGPVSSYAPGSGLSLPKEIREEIPPQEDLWDNAPGELVWRYEADPQNTNGLSWQVRKLTPGKHFEPKSYELDHAYYEASTPYRSIVYRGDSAEEALSNLLKGFAQLSREGAINPGNPYFQGSPPIQHAIHILTERLLQMVEHRRDHLTMSGYAENPAHVGMALASGYSSVGDDEQSKKAREAEQTEIMERQMLHAIARDNEVISALATAVSALARVKDF